MSSPPRPEPTHVSGEVFVASAGALLLHALAATCLFGFMGFVAPLLDATYAELGAKVNQTATAIFSITRLYEAYWLPIVLGTIVLDIVIVILLVRLPTSRRWMLTGYNYIVLALALILVARGTGLLVTPLKAWLAEQ